MFLRNLCFLRLSARHYKSASARGSLKTLERVAGLIFLGLNFYKLDLIFISKTLFVGPTRHWQGIVPNRRRHVKDLNRHRHVKVLN